VDGKHERHGVRSELAGIERNKPLVVPGIVMKIAARPAYADGDLATDLT